MRVPSRSHIYESLPPFLDNRKQTVTEQIVIGLRVANAPEQDAYQRDRERIFATFALDKAQEEADKRLRDLVRDKYVFCRGLHIDGINDDGHELTFDEFYAEAPPEIVGWVCRAVMTATELATAERKNFLPG